MKAFVLLRGKDSGMLYLYPREVYEYMQKSKMTNYGFILEFVVDHDDPKVLEQMQKLANDDIEIKD